MLLPSPGCHRSIIIIGVGYNNSNKIPKTNMSAVDDKIAAVSDEDLFKKPPPLEDSPICMLQLPSLHTGSKYKEV